MQKTLKGKGNKALQKSSDLLGKSNLHGSQAYC